MDVDERLEALEAENERLMGKIELLETALGIRAEHSWPVEWRLTLSESRVLTALTKREAMTKMALMYSIYPTRIGTDEEPQVKIIDVFICKLRKKLRPFGVTIETNWGEGYGLSAPTRERLAGLQQKEAA